MRGRPRKPHAVDSRVGALTARDEASIPPAPEWMNGEAEAWQALWMSDVGLALAPTDAPAVERLFALRAEECRLRPEVLKAGAAHPKLGHYHKLIAAIERLEDRLGLNARARLQLGLQAIEARTRLEEAGRAVTSETEQDDDDPRLDDE